MTTNPLPKEPECRMRIHFSDCDPFGHLNTARYIEYFFNAREEHVIRNYPLIRQQLEALEENWVVVSTQVAYLQPALPREEVLVRSCLLKMGRVSGLVEMVMLDQRAKNLKAMMWVKISYVNLKTNQPTSHSAELMALFRQVILTGVETKDFSKRVRERLNDLAALR